MQSPAAGWLFRSTRKSHRRFARLVPLHRDEGLADVRIPRSHCPCVGSVLRMNPVIWIVLIVFGGVAGWIGWRSATRAVYRRSYGRTDAMLADERRRYEIATITRRKRWRIVAAAAYSAGGVILGLVFLVIISHR